MFGQYLRIVILPYLRIKPLIFQRTWLLINSDCPTHHFLYECYVIYFLALTNFGPDIERTKVVSLIQKNLFYMYERKSSFQVKRCCWMQYQTNCKKNLWKNSRQSWFTLFLIKKRPEKCKFTLPTQNHSFRRLFNIK